MQTLVLEKLDRLRTDLRRGQQQLDELDRQRLELRDTMVRISGAIQILEELRLDAATAPTSVRTLQEA
jgi:prefoldin subunit 5